MRVCECLRVCFVSCSCVVCVRAVVRVCVCVRDCLLVYSVALLCACFQLFCLFVCVYLRARAFARLLVNLILCLRVDVCVLGCSFIRCFASVDVYLFACVFFMIVCACVCVFVYLTC